jgi:hypothetical protein
MVMDGKPFRGEEKNGEERVGVWRGDEELANKSQSLAVLTCSWLQALPLGNKAKEQGECLVCIIHHFECMFCMEEFKLFEGE